MPIGAKCLVTSTRVVELAARYDNEPACKPGTATGYQTGAPCVVNLTVARSMSSPIYVYYQIEGMWLNHRRRGPGMWRAASVGTRDAGAAP